MQKRVLVINDISGFGKCSSTIALPTLSCAGIETSLLPTAVLSTHLGIPHAVCTDLTDHILKTVQQWRNLSLSFDAFYCGFLASSLQSDIVKECISSFCHKNSIILLDPIMADNGNLYASVPNERINQLRRLCSFASIITPNETEAAFLLGKPYSPQLFSGDTLTHTLKELAMLGPKVVIVTGIKPSDKEIGCVAFDSDSGKIHKAFSNLSLGICQGTGDLFASVLLSALLTEHSIESSLQISVDFTSLCVKKSGQMPECSLHGLPFELFLPNLWSILQN